MTRCPRLRRCAALAVISLVAGCADLPLWDDEAASKEIKPPPGAVNGAVTQRNVRRTVCSNAWNAAARPPASFVQEAKSRLLKQHGVSNGDGDRFELDFLIPLSLGGHARKPENLWLQPSEGAWSARTKDRLEEKLRRLVCRGEVSLSEAREALRVDWKMAARYYLSDRELLEPMLNP